jgi:dGTPase
MKGGFTHPLAIRAGLSRSPELVKKVFDEVVKTIPNAEEAEVFSTLQRLFELDDTGKAPEDAAANALYAFHQSTLLASQGKLRAGFTSHLVGAFINGVNVIPQTNLKFYKIELDRAILLRIESLKHLNYQTMIMSPRLKVVENRGYDLVKELFFKPDQGWWPFAFAGGLPTDVQTTRERRRSASAPVRLHCWDDRSICRRIS